MKYQNRAFINVKRSIGKSFLLFVIIIILGSLISGAISINQAVQVTERNLINSLLPMAMIDYNHSYTNQLLDEGRSLPNLSSSDIRQIGNLPYVKNFEYSAWASLWGTELKPYVVDWGEYEGGFGEWVDPEFGLMLNIRGVHSTEMFDIQEGLIELVDGQTFNDI
jgi:putative ABC transport system permease protein